MINKPVDKPVDGGCTGWTMYTPPWTKNGKTRSSQFTVDQVRVKHPPPAGRARRILAQGGVYMYTPYTP
jgi:hypothetical protein